MSSIHLYGCVVPEPVADDLVRISSIVEKPRTEEAPSDLAVTGRYIFTPEIFEAIEATTAGVNGEIQLTDAVQILLGWQAAYGLITAERRYDIGNKLDYLRATIEIALRRSDLGDAFREVLAEVIAGDSDLLGRLGIGEVLALTGPSTLRYDGLDSIDDDPSI